MCGQDLTIHSTGPPNAAVLPSPAVRGGRLIQTLGSIWKKPVEVKQAVTAILAILAISTLLALYKKLTGNSSAGLFIFTLITYSFTCIIPYKISHKSNAARYVYLVLTIFTSLSFFAIDYEEYKLEFIVSLALIPLEIFIIYRLFQKETSNWFLSK